MKNKLKFETKKLKMRWNSNDINYENHEKKKVTNYGQGHRTNKVG